MAELTAYSHSLIEGLQARVANLKVSKKIPKMGSMVSSYLCVLHVQVMIHNTRSVNKFICHLFVNCYFTVEWKLDVDCEIWDEARNRLHVVNRPEYLLKQRGMFVSHTVMENFRVSSFYIWFISNFC